MHKQTFHVFCRTASGGQYRIVAMAADHEAARAYAQDEGHEVSKVRRAPCTPADNLARKGR